ncbi:MULTISPECIES: 2-oxoacid:acceptor oxidoreductase subunit alpha [Thermococcus]|uniref:2-oxoglutarate synthase subunit KorA n=1 Tax=Thermococcus sibiricus TaxID=172049 RepID=A0A101EN21_9EURY|nr:MULTISPECIES: 2-oxoacid:acceptor oxidoreductase subunit alpha [Thermococcus]KUK17970.1 MAG: 2-ketoglutarate:ferredoxin oxidoreductase 2 (KGOR), subunit alpha [Thermococcus sibiricus]KUK28284.1 MAG: 2-ketoglutarate:ferredoxin oxidoreductase 2 (KGOR), subunit alpha [Thermococcus sp. 40_45]MBC7095629.1 2-oxoacid:acceptor oxidoreductase subunit alpha [Thermococcus sp.]HII67555.1 2-oxoacid:acceptor oxidoreductase subunit alpha [Thermococcaceae archaeon]
MKYPFPVGAVDFIQGDEAIARAAILAGCRFYAGYPITPASEIFEAMSVYMPLVDGVNIQMEDEIGSIAAVIGASWTGAKSMTATSGPGFSLMMENLGYAIMTETPLVLVNVQRSGPSTGQPTLAAQGDLMQAIWGTHGDHSLIVLTPATVQEAFDMTIKAFNLAEKYRTPVILLTDAEVGHMRERVYAPHPDELELIYRKLPANEEEAKYPFGDVHGDLIPPMPVFGKGHHTYVTGLTHDEKGRPQTVQSEIHEKLIKRIVEKIEKNKKDIVDYEAYELEDAEIAIISFGIVARSAMRAVKELRKKGIKAGLLKFNVVWPFDFELIERIAEGVEKIYVVEMNLGQLYHMVKEGANGKAPVELISKIGGEVHTPKEIIERIKDDLR